MQKNKTRSSRGNLEKFLPVSKHQRFFRSSRFVDVFFLSLWFFVCSNVSGFVYVTEVDAQRKKITFLAPSPGTLPGKILVGGSLSWLESLEARR